ncbi:MAG: hypothetical protein BWY06_01869 [Candidatus Latescibacteria bacterium ADurb.Bin168]|nr:MAG: hypothetical protein BWY06_01869 [Candidatus Latescibacteria bacterium ADurb.Bin168]
MMASGVSLMEKESRCQPSLSTEPLAAMRKRIRMPSYPAHWVRSMRRSAHVVWLPVTDATVYQFVPSAETSTWP